MHLEAVLKIRQILYLSLDRCFDAELAAILHLGSLGLLGQVVGDEGALPTTALALTILARGVFAIARSLLIVVPSWTRLGITNVLFDVEDRHLGLLPGCTQVTMKVLVVQDLFGLGILHEHVVLLLFLG